MGVDIRLFVNHKWDVGDVQDTLESLYGKVEYRASHTPDMALLCFKYSADEQRDMHVHINTEVGGFKGMLLTLRATYGHAKEIMEAVAKRLGGFLNYEDVNSDYVAIETLGQGNLDWHLKHAIVNGETDGRDIRDFAAKAIALSDKMNAEHEARQKEFWVNLPKRKKTA